MTETTEHVTTTRTGRGNGLSGMVLTDLKAMASEMGIKGISGMRKGDLIAVINERRTGGPADATARPPGGSRRRAATRQAGAPDGQPTLTDATGPVGQSDNGSGRPHHEPSRAAVQESAHEPSRESSGGTPEGRSGGPNDGPNGGRSDGRGSKRHGKQAGDKPSGDKQARDKGPDDGDSRRNKHDRGNTDRNNTDRGDRDRHQVDRNDGDRNSDRGGNDRNNERNNDGGGRRRGRRYRDRNRRGRDRTGDSGEPEIREDDVLIPVSGVVDVLDSYAFVRTSGYLAGSKDVYVSMSQVRKHGLRRGDMITGSIKAPREGEQQSQRQKYTPLAKLETINGLEPEMMRGRPEFTKLTPLYPNERLRLETTANAMTTRVIDLVMPVGKGQRALIVSPPKAGKTMVMQAIANAITTNNPECHLMVVLVDERPEEVTDMQRSVNGEVIASTFDRPPSDHTSVAELSIERAKRLVEMGKDVVVLLDSITRLGRAYNLAAPASGRILSGGVDSTALFPPKRFLGAARNIENGGSLTIFATALVETGSAGDTVIFEEFKGTGNAELKLDRRLADKRLFPAIDIDASSTRKEELLMSPDELAVTVKLRRVLAALEPQQALELVLDKLRKSQHNAEFLMSVAKNMPTAD